MTSTNLIGCIAAMALVSLLAIRAQAANGYVLTAQWGQTGSGAGEFREPMGVCLDAQGNVYVADSRNHRVQKLSPGGRFLAEFGVAGVLKKPVDIAIGPEGILYVADFEADHIQAFSKEGKQLYGWGEPGEGNGQFRSPAGIAVDKGGDVYVADFYNSRIQVFDPMGKWLKSIGRKGRGSGEFTYPTGLTFDGSGNLLVADAYNHRVQKFAPDGRVLEIFGSPMKRFFSPGGFHVPSGIAVDGPGNIYVADSANKRVVFLGPNGEYRGDWKLTQDNRPNVYSPTHITAGADGRIFAVDTANDRVLVLGPGTSELIIRKPKESPGAESVPGDLIVQIEGMACPFCAYGIEKHLSRIPGVRSARINLGAGTAVLELEPGIRMVPFDDVRKAVEKAGFKASELKEMTPLRKANP